MPKGLDELTSLHTLDRFFMAGNDSKSTKDGAEGFAKVNCLDSLKGKLAITNSSHNLQVNVAKSEAANLKEK